MTPPRPVDFIGKSEESEKAEQQIDSGLCCCEYINKDYQRFHILGCCCNCESFDLTFTRLITCRRLDQNLTRDMLLTFQDRLRLPWHGGAKQVSLVTLIPIIVIPLLFGLAAINAYTFLVILISSILFIGYAYYYVQRAWARTRFFCMWIFWSIVYMITLFECTVPLMELLPEENLILVILTSTSLFCFWRTRQRAKTNQVVQSTVAEDELPDITEASQAEEEEAAAHTSLLLEHEHSNDHDHDHGHNNSNGNEEVIRLQPDICSNCRKYVPARTAHCLICGSCIMQRDHHSYWLDCCIGKYNHRYYLAGLILAELSLLLGANLSLTAICHPYLVQRILGIPFMLPDDCSEVFEDYDLSLSFVISSYAIIIALYIMAALLRQLYLISRGITLHECQRGQCRNRKTIWDNWKAFLF